MKDVDEQIDHAEDIIRAISRLTDRQKIAVLAAMLGYTQSETGKILGISQQTVSTILGQCVENIETLGSAS